MKKEKVKAKQIIEKLYNKGKLFDYLDQLREKEKR